MGELRFSGPGAPSRWPAPALVPLVSTNIKSAALLSVSCSCVVVSARRRLDEEHAVAVPATARAGATSSRPAREGVVDAERGQRRIAGPFLVERVGLGGGTGGVEPVGQDIAASARVVVEDRDARVVGNVRGVGGVPGGVGGERVVDRVDAEIVPAGRDDGAVRYRAAGDPVRGRDAIARAREGRNRVIGPSRVVDFDELVVGPAWTAQAEFRNDELRARRRGLQQAQREREGDAPEGARQSADRETNRLEAHPAHLSWSVDQTRAICLRAEVTRRGWRQIEKAAYSADLSDRSQREPSGTFCLSGKEAGVGRISHKRGAQIIYEECNRLVRTGNSSQCREVTPQEDLRSAGTCEQGNNLSECRTAQLMRAIGTSVAHDRNRKLTASLRQSHTPRAQKFP